MAKPLNENVGTEIVMAMGALNTYPMAVVDLENKNAFLRDIEPMVEHSYEHLQSSLGVLNEVKKLVSELSSALRRVAVEDNWSSSQWTGFEGKISQIQRKL